MTLHVLAVAYERVIPLRILMDCFLVQSNPDWKLHVIYDGPAPQEVWEIINLYNDPRIIFYESEIRRGNAGHSNRQIYLQTIPMEPNDWVLMTNDDNYYVPKFVEYFMKEAHPIVGLIYCNTIHSHQEYNLHYSHLVECGIDMGAFAVRADVAKENGFNHTHFSADGLYAQECTQLCNRKGLMIRYINKFLFIHN